MNKKKQYIAAAVLILAGLLILGKVIWEQIVLAPNDVSSPQQAETPKSPDFSSPPKTTPEIEVSANEEILETLLYGNTFEYIDEYRSGYPVTYTFYKNGQLLVYYWTREETEDVPIGSAEAFYTLNSALNEITITWKDDNSTEVKAFALEKGKIKLGDSELKENSKELYINGKEILHE